MADPIQVNYTPDGDDWTVSVRGRGQTLTGRAVGLIAARDRADQLVEKLAPEEGHKTVVHLLNGDAVEFTTAYLTARLAKSDPPAQAEEPEEEQAEEPTESAARPEAQLAKPTPAPRTAPEPAAAEQKPTPSPKPREQAPAQEPVTNSGS
jgi:outer membrane biosynthesis protein TonB